MSSIFISYSHNDKAFVKKLATDLRNAIHTVWIDETDISVGDSIIEKLSDAIKNVDFVVAIISSASVNSCWVQKELDLASNRELNENRIVLLPVLLNDVQLPGFLYGKFYLDFSKKDNYQEYLVKLLEKLETDSTPQKVSFDQIFLKPYLFIETEGHGWLRVPLSELNELDISDKVTGYSYMDNLYAYLEEDCDLVTFIEAKERRNGHSYEVERDACTLFVNDDEFSSFCNRLLSFETSTPKLKIKQTHRRLYVILMSVAALATLLSFLFGDNIWDRFSKEFKDDKPAAKQIETPKTIVVASATVEVKIMSDLDLNGTVANVKAYLAFVKGNKPLLITSSIGYTANQTGNDEVIYKAKLDMDAKDSAVGNPVSFLKDAEYIQIEFGRMPSDSHVLEGDAICIINNSVRLEFSIPPQKLVNNRIFIRNLSESLRVLNEPGN